MPAADAVPTRRRLEYALGYLGLGLLDEASDEMEAIAFPERNTLAVLEVRLALHSQAGHWDIVESCAHLILQQDRQQLSAWISLGCAVRRLRGFAAARDTLLQAERILGEGHGVVHFNLACYHCLLGHLEAAKDRLEIACRLDAKFKTAALEDEDLKALWDAIASMP